MGIHVGYERRYHLRAEPHIRIYDEVVLAAPLHRGVEGHVVTATVTVVLVGQVYQLKPLLGLLSQLWLTLEHSLGKLLQLSLQIQHTVRMVHDIHHLHRRSEKASQDRLKIKQMVVVCHYAGTDHSYLLFSLFNEIT